MPQNQYKISTKLVCPWYVFVLRFSSMELKFSSSITDIFNSWNIEFKFRSFLQCITHPVFSCGGARLGTLIEFVITCSRLGLAKKSIPSSQKDRTWGWGPDLFHSKQSCLRWFTRLRRNVYAETNTQRNRRISRRSGTREIWSLHFLNL